MTGSPSTRPDRPRWTHLALRVRDLDAMIEFYESFTPLQLLQRREDDDGYGAWLGQPDQLEFPFLLVLSQFFTERDPWRDTPLSVLRPFNHIGIEVPERHDVDDVAARADANGCLEMQPTQMPDPIGYICMISDPEGNLIEFSHDQGVYATAREVWGSSVT